MIEKVNLCVRLQFFETEGAVDKNDSVDEPQEAGC